MGYKGEFTVKVTRTEVVEAPLPMHDHWLPLSNLDLLLPPVNVGVFFCYKKFKGDQNKCFTFESMVNVLKNSLAEALVLYYAFAGEVVMNTMGEPEILCNNNGVDFSEAFADVELPDLNLYNPDESIEGKLVPKKNQGVLAVQATELKCGGLVVACSFDHRVADAYSTNMFLISWSELAESKPLSQLPSYRRSLLNPRRLDRRYYHCSIDEMYGTVFSLLPPKLPHPPNNPMISRIYYIESNDLNHLQSLSNDSENNSSITCKKTKLEAFSGFLWTLVAYEDDGKNDKVCKMGIVVDGRKRLTTNLMTSYFGNVLSIPFCVKKSKELREKPLSWVVDSVHNLLNSAATEDHFYGLIDWVEAHRPEPILAKIYGSRGGKEELSAFVVSSGTRFPIQKVDFGWGKPAFSSYHFPWRGEAGYVMPMPSPVVDGDWIVYMHLLKGQVDLIEAKAGHIFKALSPDYMKL